jgi:hypothetical protein
VTLLFLMLSPSLDGFFAKKVTAVQKRTTKSSNPQGPKAMRSWVTLLFLMLSPSLATALSTGDADNPVRVGDQWTYDTKDEITGTVTRTYTAAVSEITPQEIVTHITYRGNNNTALVAFDHEWNRVANGEFKSKPNDGHGVRFPLMVGNQWRFEYITTNVRTGVSWKGAGLSKVVAQEKITTPAGTFEIFEIERQLKEYNAADPSRSNETLMSLWYAPEINHWVRRTFVVKIEKRTSRNETDELTAFARGQ